jgi:hypothetical protein
MRACKRSGRASGQQSAQEETTAASKKKKHLCFFSHFVVFSNPRLSFSPMPSSLLSICAAALIASAWAACPNQCVAS